MRSKVNRTRVYDYSTSFVLGKKGKLMVNVCNGVTVPDKCKLNHTPGVLFVPDSGDDCQSYLSYNNVKDNFYNIRDESAPLNGFSMGRKDSSFTIDIVCNENADSPIFTLLSSGLKIESRNSCGMVNEAARLFDSHRFLLPLLMMVFGVLLIFIGGYKWEFLMGLIGFLAGFLGIYVMFWAAIEYKQETSSYVIIFIIAFITGCLLGYLCNEYAMISYVLIGLATGLFGSQYLLTIFEFSGDRVS